VGGGERLGSQQSLGVLTSYIAAVSAGLLLRVTALSNGNFNPKTASYKS
jgi:hypothetical protein